MSNLKKTMICATLLAALGAGQALAVCNQTTSSQAEKDLWNVHGCWQDFFNWSYQSHDQRYSDWSNRGWTDACNVNKEFGKHWNAAYLVTYGLSENSWQWHGTTDYRQLSERYSGNFHGSIYHACDDDTCCFGSYSPSSGRVATHCPVYDPAWSQGNPASRAGDFMHEGWHAWLQKGGWNNGSCGGHRCGPTGNCSASGCDYFYFHGAGAYAFGTLYQTDGTANRFHSPNQVQVEFLCDVYDYPQNWVPWSVRSAAKTDADYRSATRFINGPGYKCGNYRPW
jgi:hypothetical protein